MLAALASEEETKCPLALAVTTPSNNCSATAVHHNTAVLNITTLPTPSDHSKSKQELLFRYFYFIPFQIL